jgi:formamidopyrimidine-DNA glycosylase
MIAGRLRWREPGRVPTNKSALAQLELSGGTVLLTEASPKKRASIHLIQGRAALAEHDRGGIDVFASADETVAAALRRDNHTVKRALTDPAVLAGIGNAYSDEILHHARLSPFQQTQKLSDGEMATLIVSMRAVLRHWTDRLRAEVGEGFPDKVTAFHAAMAVHGRYGKPCPRCGCPVQRIRYADNEANYCAECQNAGKLLADRSLSQLLKKDWPKTLEDLETLKKDARAKAGN